MRLEQIRDQLAHKLLGALAGMNQGGGFAEGEEYFEFSDGLEAQLEQGGPHGTTRRTSTIGTRESDWVPLAASFPRAWPFVALQRRSRSDLSKEVAGLVAERTAIFCNACWRISRIIFGGPQRIGVQRRRRNNWKKQRQRKDSCDYYYGEIKAELVRDWLYCMQTCCCDKNSEQQYRKLDGV